MSIEQQAEELARWLEANPGTDPPEGLDPEVLEVVYALRPELAPAPRVTVEDILNSVQSGPLADPEQAIASEHLAEVVPFPPPNASLKEATSNPNLPIDRASNNPLKAFNSRWFLLTASSVALLAAASALLIVVPALQGGFFIQNPSPELAMADSVEKGESTASAKHSVSPPPAPPARGSENRTGNKRDAPRELYTSSPVASDGQAIAQNTPSSTGPTSKRKEHEPREDASFAVADAFEAPEPLDVHSDLDGIESNELSQEMADEDPSDPGLSPLPDLNDDSSASAGASALGGFDQEEEVTRTRISSITAPSAPATVNKDSRSPAPRSESMSDMSSSTPKNSEKTAADLKMLSAASKPTARYRPTLSDESARLWSQANSALSAGDPGKALSILERGIQSPASIGLFFAYEACQVGLKNPVHLKTGLSLGEKGLALTSSSTPERTAVLWCVGETHRKMGNSSKAMRKFQKALKGPR